MLRKGDEIRAISPGSGMRTGTRGVVKFVSSLDDGDVYVQWPTGEILGVSSVFIERVPETSPEKTSA